MICIRIRSQVPGAAAAGSSAGDQEHRQQDPEPGIGDQPGRPQVPELAAAGRGNISDN